MTYVATDDISQHFRHLSVLINQIKGISKQLYERVIGDLE